MLHTISNSVIDIELIGPNDAVLFWQNGIVLATKDNAILSKILTKTSHCYALNDDIIARGLSSLIDENITIIDMKGIISLTTLYYPQIKW